MKCPDCGTEVADGVEVCSVCNRVLTPSSSSISSITPQEVRRKIPGLRIAFRTLGYVLFIIGIIGLIVIMRIVGERNWQTTETVVDDNLVVLLTVLMVAAPGFFWARGMIRGNGGDMAAGEGLLVAISFVALCCGDLLITAGRSCRPGRGPSGGPIVGVIFFLFGVVTLVVNLFAPRKCLLTRSERITIGIVTILIGIGLLVFS